MTVGGQTVNFLVDMGSKTHLKETTGPLSEQVAKIQGATGKIATYKFTTNQKVDLAKAAVTHSFLLMPDCPYPLMGQDLLHKLGANISFKEEDPKVTF